MSNSKDDLSTKSEVNLTPGFAAIVLAIGIIAMGFYAGATVFPLGGLAIAGCVFGTIQMLTTKRVAPGYASVVIAIITMAAALAMSA